MSSGNQSKPLSEAVNQIRPALPMRHRVRLDRSVTREPHVPGRAERQVETSCGWQVFRNLPGSGLYPIKDNSRRAGFLVYLLVAWGVRREVANSEPHGGNCGAGCRPNRPVSCLVSCSTDCPRNHFPGCCPGCGQSRCPRCSTRCSLRRSDRCGLSRRPHNSPRCSDRCSPDCG